MFRAGKRFRGISNREIAQLVSFLTGSLGEFLDQNYESEKIKTMFLANNVYGKHGGPYQPGTAIGLLFHLLSGGEHELQGFYGHVVGGMGSITQALATAGKKLGVEIRTGATVAHIEVKNGRARSVVLDDGTDLRARMMLSNADPKRTFLELTAATDACTRVRTSGWNAERQQTDSPALRPPFVESGPEAGKRNPIARSAVFQDEAKRVSA